MQMVQKESADRVIFLDNIRYLMVLLVVMLHSANGYSNYTTWWTVNDDNSVFVDYLLGFLDVFLMPTLFFIAGYFALPSLQQKGKWHFIKNKLKRLGIPWLLGIFLLVPIINYIYHYSRGYPATLMSLWRKFSLNFEEVLSFHTGLITSLVKFHQHHFWFISLLLVFFIVFAFLHDGKRKLIPSIFFSEKPKTSSIKSILFIFFLVGSLTTLITIIIYGIFHETQNKDPWIIIVSLIQFQANKIVLYISCFGLGVYAFSNEWLKNGKTPGNFIFWTILSIGLMYFQGKIFLFLINNFSFGLAVGYVLMRTFLAFTILLALISFGIKHWNNPSKFSRQLAENSYNIYLLHMLFVIVVQLLLLKWFGIPIFIKFGIVTLSTILLSYLISQYAIRPFPKLSIAGMIAIFVLLIAILSPTAS